MENKDELAHKLLCKSCLCFGRTLQVVQDEKLKQYYINVLEEIPLNTTPMQCPNICRECIALLKKAVSFRDQVQDSYRILQTYTNENLKECLLTDVTRPPRLKIQALKTIDILPKDKADSDVKDELKDMQINCVKDEMKNELNFEEREMDIPHSDDSSDNEELSKIKQLAPFLNNSERETEEHFEQIKGEFAKKQSKSEDESELEREIESFLRGKKKKGERNESKNKKNKKLNNKNFNKCLLTDSASTQLLKEQAMETIDILAKDDVDSDMKDDPKQQRTCCVTDEMKNELNFKERETDFPHSGESSEDEELSKIEQVEPRLNNPDHEIEEHFEQIKDKLESKHSNSEEESELEREIESYLMEKKKKSKKIGKKRKKNKKENNKSIKTCKADDKILAIELSYEEMLSERELEASRDSFKRAKFKCNSCIIGFNYQTSYTSHMSTKHSPDLGDYSCPICKTLFPGIEPFTAHYKRHVRRYVCGICQKRTVDMKVMQQHYYSTHEISLKQYTCSLCGHVSNSFDTHRYHMDTHKARLQCPECDKSFIHRAGLTNHRLAVHEFRNAFPCTICNKVFRWKTSLKRHLEKHDVQSTNSSTVAYCSTCEVSFSSVCSYQRHLKNSLKHVTQDQLRYICDHCNRRFADKTKLRDHIEEKHLHRTYQCHLCLKPSKNRVGLDQHIRNVHRGRPKNKMCHHCGKGFPTKVQLESHIRTHTGERPFICEFCPTMFSQQSNLYKHNRQVHLNMKSKRLPGCKKRREDIEPTTNTLEMAVQAPDHRPMMAVLHYPSENYCPV